MSARQATVLEDLFRQWGLGWVLDYQGVAHYSDRLERASAAFADGTTLTEEILAAENQSNPHKVAAFLQALIFSRSPRMLAMVWRILQGWRVHQVNLSYLERDHFHLAVVVMGHDRTERYETDDIFDGTLLRHFGIMTSDGKPVFDGFYPLHLGAIPAKATGSMTPAAEPT